MILNQGGSRISKLGSAEEVQEVMLTLILFILLVQYLASTKALNGHKTQSGKKRGVPGKHLKMTEVNEFLDTAEDRLGSRQNTKAVLTTSLGNQFAAKAKELFWSKGLSKITNETEMAAALFFCAKATGTYDQVQRAYKNDKGGKLITHLCQKIVKALSSTDRILRNDVS